MERIDHSITDGLQKPAGSDLHKTLLICSPSTKAHRDAGCKPDIQFGQFAKIDTMRCCIHFETFCQFLAGTVCKM